MYSKNFFYCISIIFSLYNEMYFLLDMGWTCGKNGRLKIRRKQMPRKWKGKGGEEDRECDGRTALREIWKEREENGEQQLYIEEVGDG